MAYTSDESGQREVYVRPFPSGEPVWTVSTKGGEMPRWRGDSKELYYIAADNEMMVVSVKAVPGPKPSFEVGTAEALFESQMTSGTGPRGLYQYDVTADGKRFLVTSNLSEQPSSPPLTVWVNWQAGLKK